MPSATCSAVRSTGWAACGPTALDGLRAAARGSPCGNWVPHSRSRWSLAGCRWASALSLRSRGHPGGEPLARPQPRVLGGPSFSSDLTSAAASPMIHRSRGNTRKKHEERERFMRVIRLYEYGGPEVLKLEDAPVPEPGPGEVLVRVGAAGVNYADTRRRLGVYVEPTPLPWVMGSEIAGTVAKL